MRFYPIAILCISIIFLISCTCEPSPEKRQFNGLLTQAGSFSYDTTYNLTASFEAQYRSIKQKDKKFGCLGYYKVLSFYYGDTLEPSSLQVFCKENVGTIPSGTDWMQDSHTQKQFSGGNFSGPNSHILLGYIIGRVAYHALPDTLHFTWKAKNSQMVGFSDNFSYGIR